MLLLVALAFYGTPRAAAQAVDKLGTPRVEGAGGAATPPPTDSNPASQIEWLAVVEPTLVGVDPSIAAPLSRQLAESARALGYRIRPAGEVAAAAQRVGLGPRALPADLWRVTYASGSEASLHVRVWASQGRYVLELTAALLDGRGPFRVRRRTDHLGFLQTVDAMVREALPEAGSGTPAPAAPASPRRPPPGLPPSEFEPERPETAPTEAAPLRRVGIALSTEAAIGLGQRFYYNHLVGARLDVRLTHEVVLGAYAGYVNLAGRQHREHNLLGYLQVEDRVRVSQRHDLRVPLRFGAGYMPHNGPVLRMAVGIAYPVSERLEWGIDLLTPTIWFLPEGQVATSLNLGFEMIFNP